MQINLKFILFFVSLFSSVAFLASCKQEEDPVISKALSESINCPDGAHVEMSGWGKSGFSRSCKMKHGKFIGWEGGYKVVEGHFSFGLEDGVWVWYDESGNVTNKIVYEKGKKIESLKK